MELHTNFDTSLLDVNSIDPSQIIQIICDFCGGIPVSPVKCRLCSRVFCNDFFVSHVNQTLECPSCRNGGASGGEHLSDPLNSQLDDLAFFQKQDLARNLLMNKDLTPDEQQIFDNLRIRCPNNNVGCGMVLPLSSQSEHFTHCLQTCRHCNQPYLLTLEQLHQQQCLPYLEDQARIKEQERRQERVNLDLLSKQKEKEASVRILQNDLIEQEMNLIHRKNKLYKTKIVALMLFVIAVLHMFNQREEQQGSSITIRSFNSVSHLLNDNLFRSIQSEGAKITRLIRYEDVLREMRDHLIADKSYSLFDINRFRDQLTPSDFFCEYFTQLVYFIKNIQNQSYSKDLVLSCSQQKRADESRSGLGNECLKKQLSREEYNKQIERIQLLSQIAQKDEVSYSDRKNVLLEFFNELESAVDQYRRSRHEEVIRAIHILRDELGLK